MRERLQALLERHLATLRREIIPIVDAVDRLDRLDGADPALLDHRIHTLKGSAGSLGFGDVFRLAATLEGRIAAYRTTGVPDPARDVARQLSTLIAQLRIDDSTLFEQFGGAV
jgi:HPt (histidine-containing phosphotransfer) domain-containing protein